MANDATTIKKNRKKKRICYFILTIASLCVGILYIENATLLKPYSLSSSSSKNGGGSHHQIMYHSDSTGSITTPVFRLLQAPPTQQDASAFVDSIANVTFQQQQQQQQQQQSTSESIHHHCIIMNSQTSSSSSLSSSSSSSPEDKDEAPYYFILYEYNLELLSFLVEHLTHLNGLGYRVVIIDNSKDGIITSTSSTTTSSSTSTSGIMPSSMTTTTTTTNTNHRSKSSLLQNVLRIYRPFIHLTFSEMQLLASMIAHFNQHKVYLWGHQDAIPLPKPGQDATHFCAHLTDLVHEVQNPNTTTAVGFTNYDLLAVFNTEALIRVPWDTGLCHYLSDCDVYNRLRLKGYTTTENGRGLVGDIIHVDGPIHKMFPRNGTWEEKHHSIKNFNRNNPNQKNYKRYGWRDEYKSKEKVKFIKKCHRQSHKYYFYKWGFNWGSIDCENKNQRHPKFDYTMIRLGPYRFEYT